ncbi:hypothetical protein Tco_0483825 [Tanacetum coccineum]
MWGTDGNVMGIHDFLAFPSGPVLRFRRSLITILGLLCRGFLYTVPPVFVDAAIPDPTPEDLAVGNPSAKAEASHKRKASTSGATSSHVIEYVIYLNT